jgi:hypothetical protein
MELLLGIRPRDLKAKARQGIDSSGFWYFEGIDRSITPLWVIVRGARLRRWRSRRMQIPLERLLFCAGLVGVDPLPAKESFDRSNDPIQITFFFDEFLRSRFHRFFNYGSEAVSGMKNDRRR